MAMRYEDLNDMHLDVLKEIGNIGAGNAATSLSTMLNETVDIRLPRVKITDFNDAIASLGGAEALIIGVLVDYSGEVSGMIMFLLSLEDAKNITQILVGVEEGEPENGLSELKLSAIQEIGNILAAAYINAIASLTGLAIDISVPNIAADMAGAILSVPMIQFGQLGDKVMLVEEGFFTEQHEIGGNVVMFMEMDSLSTIMQRLGIDI